MEFEEAERQDPLLEDTTYRIIRNFIKEFNIREYEVVMEENEEDYYESIVSIEPYSIYYGQKSWME